MPSVLFKAPITEELEKNLPPACVDLMCGESGLWHTMWNLMQATGGSLELAYRRGYQAGYEDRDKVNQGE